ncbi:MAG: HlyD family efflux transporter periplasmic adaptor subunit [Chromatiales bacterium]|nr:HlyD family efflux transporter periplasmic adaptor subunit [Chromatiales bacterium]
MSASPQPLPESDFEAPTEPLERPKPWVVVPLPAAVAEDWLALQCQMVAGVISGGLFSLGDDGTPTMLAFWPQDSRDSSLVEFAGQAMNQQRSLVRSQIAYGSQGQHTADLIACPLVAADRLLGVAALRVSTRSQAQQQAVTQLLQWGGLWLENLLRQHAAALRATDRFTVELATRVLTSKAARLAAMEIVNQLSDYFGCERVAIGRRRGPHVSLLAVSRMAKFDERTHLMRSIESAMEEALEQNTSITVPVSNSGTTLIRAHQELAAQRPGAVLSVPLPGLQAFMGAITLERAADRPFDEEERLACQTLAGLIGPALESKLFDERPLARKLGSALSRGLGALLGRAYLKTKLLLLAIAALLAFSSLMEAEYRVSAPAGIEGSVRQVLVAPNAGYVQEAPLRAGDKVKAGDLIARLDDSELQLERSKWQSERKRVEKQYQEALAKRERTELSLLRAKLDEIDAELRLVDGRIARTRLLAPMDGMVVSGDYSQSLGVPVEQGQILFEVAPLDHYRVVLEVDERDVGDLYGGKHGTLVLSAFPDAAMELTVGEVVPVAISRDGRNYFRVEASLDSPSELLRPGMRGVAKVDMGSRTLLWIATHALWDRLRLWAWSLGF